MECDFLKIFDKNKYFIVYQSDERIILLNKYNQNLLVISMNYREKIKFINIKHDLY